MLSSPRKNGLTSLFKEVRVSKVLQPSYTKKCFLKVERESLRVFISATGLMFKVRNESATLMQIDSTVIWPLKSFFRTPERKGSSEPQTGFYRTFRIEPTPTLLKLPF